jgi:acid phosphatase
LAATVAVPAQAATPTLDFVTIGDWGRRGAEHQIDVATAMAREAAATHARFVVSVGDNFYENGVASTTDPHWDVSFEGIYRAPSLRVPWWVALGNHDYRGNVEAQLAYGTTDGRWRMPGRYFSFSERLEDGSEVLFVLLDTSPFISAYRGTKVRIDGQDTAAQLRWLDATLTASRARWKIVIGHHPLVLATPRNSYDPGDLAESVMPILRRHDVRHYLNGHVHTLEYAAMDGLSGRTSGAGSKTYRRIDAPTTDGGFASIAHGFLAVRLSPESLSARLIDIEGRTIFARALPLNG